MATKMQLQPMAFANLEKYVIPAQQLITKNQLNIGSILHYYGKDAPNTLWKVYNIRYSSKFGWQSHKNIHTVNDIVCLMLSPEEKSLAIITRWRRFRHISKSPLWRLQ